MSEAELEHLIEGLDAQIAFTEDALDEVCEVEQALYHEHLVRSLQNLQKQRRELLA